MAEAYKRTLQLYSMAKNTADSNTLFNVDSQRLSIQEDYLSCLRLLATYARTHDGSVIAWAIWGRRKRLGLKFQGRNLTVGAVKAGDIEVGITHELKSPFEIQKFLENTMQFTNENLRSSLREHTTS